MSQPVQVERLRLHTDHRGWVFEPLRPDQIPGQRNVHVVLTAPGEVRGNHFHPRGTEVMSVVGPALLRTRHQGVVTDLLVPPGECHRFTIAPGVVHAVRNTGAEPQFLVAFNTEEHDSDDPDTVREVILE